MKNRCKRLLALILEAILSLGLLGWSATAVSAKPVELVCNATRHTCERILNIHKEIPESGEGEADVIAEYAVYYVAQLREVLFGEVCVSRIPTTQELAQYQTRENLIASVKTGAAGLASIHLGYADGVYLVVEKDSAAPVEKSEPFYVCVPTADPSGDGWLYTVDVFPRNGPMVGPKVDQDVTAVGSDLESFDVGERITYIIRGGVPADLYRVAADGSQIYAQSYRLTNVLDLRLDYLGDVEVKLYTRAGEETVLTAGAHYALAEIPAAENRGARMAVSLTEAGMRYITEHLDSGGETAELQVFFTAAINAGASAGDEIVSSAGIAYIDSAAYEYPPQRVSGENCPRVHVGRDDRAEARLFQIPE